jgi:hypothetical protein
MPAVIHPLQCRHRQRGAVLITVALTMLLLLGFIGAALDFGRLFVIKTELQTAMDGCALAAAQELDRLPDAIARARSAGQNAGNQNRVGFQSVSWGGLGQIDAASEITFRDRNYTPTTVPASAAYAQCQHTQTGVPSWLLQALGGFSGNTALAANSRDVTALAVATRGSAQSTCPLPLAVRPKVGGTAPNYGYSPGEWVTLLSVTDPGTPGYIGWANLDGTNSAANTVAEINGYCGVSVGTNLGTPGVQSTIVDNWNWRFGIYKNNQHPYDQFMQPDLTGYAYTDRTWPPPAGCASPCIRNAYSGDPPAGAPAGAANFVAKRAAYANCIDTTTVTNQSVTTCRDLLFPPSNPPRNLGRDLIEGGTASTTGHRRYGGNRRIVMVPVTNGYPGSVQDFVCMLMLQPLTTPMSDVQLEFIGNAADPASPCAASGLPGGTAGPLVPVLVR